MFIVLFIIIIIVFFVIVYYLLLLLLLYLLPVGLSLEVVKNATLMYARTFLLFDSFIIFSFAVLVRKNLMEIRSLSRYFLSPFFSFV